VVLSLFGGGGRFAEFSALLASFSRCFWRRLSSLRKIDEERNIRPEVDVLLGNHLPRDGVPVSACRFCFHQGDAAIGKETM
jgi:hypothetical protein